jgi:hypothetical protein
MLTVKAQDPCAGVTGSSYCESKNQSSGSDPLFGANGIATKVTQFLTIIAGLASVISLILGGIQFITSSGDSQKVKKARTTLIYASIGMVVSLLAQGVVSFILSKI